MVAVLVFAVLFGGGDDDGTKERDEKAQEKHSQNSFGAMIRNEFNCEVRFRGGDQWRLLSLTGLEN